MTRFRLALSIIALSIPTFVSAQTPRPSDQAAVRAVVADYIEAYYTGDAARMEKSLHPSYLKHTISGPENRQRMSERTGLEMVEDVRASGPVNLPASEKREDISVLDVSGDIASVKLTTSHWVDYLTLAKWNGEWKIVAVVLREND